MSYSESAAGEALPNIDESQNGRQIELNNYRDRCELISFDDEIDAANPISDALLKSVGPDGIVKFTSFS